MLQAITKAAAATRMPTTKAFRHASFDIALSPQPSATTRRCERRAGYPGPSNAAANERAGRVRHSKLFEVSALIHDGQQVVPQCNGAS
jgi:hypothetical protein